MGIIKKQRTINYRYLAGELLSMAKPKTVNNAFVEVDYFGRWHYPDLLYQPVFINGHNLGQIYRGAFIPTAFPSVEVGISRGVHGIILQDAESLVSRTGLEPVTG